MGMLVVPSEQSGVWISDPWFLVVPGGLLKASHLLHVAFDCCNVFVGTSTSTTGIKGDTGAMVQHTRLWLWRSEVLDESYNTPVPIVMKSSKPQKSLCHGCSVPRKKVQLLCSIGGI